MFLFQDFDDDFLALEEAAEKERLKSLQEYKKLAEKTKNVRLDKLIQVKDTSIYLRSYSVFHRLRLAKSAYNLDTLV